MIACGVSGRSLPGNVPPLAKAHAHGLQVTRGNDVHESPVRSGFVICVFFGHQAPTPVAVERQHVGHARSFDAGNCPDTLQDLFDNRPAPLGFSAIIHFDVERGDMRGLEAEIHVQQPDEAAQQQARAGQQHACQRHLRHHQRGSKALVSSALAHALAAVFQRLVQVTGRDLERWERGRRVFPLRSR